MRSITAFLSLLALAILIPCAMAFAVNWKTIDDDSWCNESRYNSRTGVCETRELDIDKSWDSIHVDASPNGGIVVEGWKNRSIRVKVMIQAHAESEEMARGILSDIEIRTENHTIDATGPKRMHSNQSWSVSFSLMVPENSDLDLNALNGAISISNVNGKIEAKTLNGGIKLAMTGGDVKAGTTNGGITAALIGDRWQGRGLDLYTTNGAIKLSVPENYSAELEAGTVNGGMKIDFPVKVQGWIKKRITTTLGKGGASIKARTTNGSVTIARE